MKNIEICSPQNHELSTQFFCFSLAEEKLFDPFSGDLAINNPQNSAIPKMDPEKRFFFQTFVIHCICYFFFFFFSMGSKVLSNQSGIYDFENNVL